MPCLAIDRSSFHRTPRPAARHFSFALLPSLNLACRRPSSRRRSCLRPKAHFFCPLARRAVHFLLFQPPGLLKTERRVFSLLCPCRTALKLTPPHHHTTTQPCRLCRSSTCCWWWPCCCCQALLPSSFCTITRGQCLTRKGVFWMHTTAPFSAFRTTGPITCTRWSTGFVR